MWLFITLLSTLLGFSDDAVSAAIYDQFFIPKKVVTSFTHTCVLSTEGQVKCWGSNQTGSLGIGSRIDRGTMPLTMGKDLPLVDLGSNFHSKNICVGRDFTCAVGSAGKIKCWGSNFYGVLGQEHSVLTKGDKPTDMGDSLPFTELGDDFFATDVQCGFDKFACALNGAGKVKCWGVNGAGQQGRVIANRGNIGDEKGDMGNALPYLPLPKPIKQISLGSAHACAAAADSVYCWGNNDYGQTGAGVAKSPILLPVDGTSPNPVQLEGSGIDVRIESLGVGAFQSCVLYRAVLGSGMSVSPQKVKCWGFNNGGGLGNGSTAEFIGTEKDSMGASLSEVPLDASDISQLAVYEYHRCVLFSGKIKCWGSNYSGQLGYGDMRDRGLVPSDMGKNLPLLRLGVPALSLGFGGQSNMCAILVNHEVKCWGFGGYGSLGYEDTVDRGAQQSDMGDNLPYVRFQ